MSSQQPKFVAEAISGQDEEAARIAPENKEQ
jgi:hypothetical protein